MTTKKIAYLAASLLLCACGSTENGTLYIDMNGTAQSPVRLFSVDDGFASPVAEASDKGGGIYTFNTDSLDYGVYRVDIDSANRFDVVVGSVNPLLVCARKGYLAEATTNSPDTKLLWQAEKLHQAFCTVVDTIVANSDLKTKPMREQAAALVNSAAAQTRSLADSLLAQAKQSVAAIQILNIGAGRQCVYNIFDDYELFAECAENLSAKYPQNAQIRQFAQMVANEKRSIDFMKDFAPGKPLESIKVMMPNGKTVATGDFDDRHKIFFYITDTTKTAMNMWQFVAQKRFDGYKVIAALPPKFDTKPGTSVCAGSIVNNPNVEIMNELQPILIITAPNDTIKKSVMRATPTDINNVW